MHTTLFKLFASFGVLHSLTVKTLFSKQKDGIWECSIAQSLSKRVPGEVYSPLTGSYKSQVFLWEC